MKKWIWLGVLLLVVVVVVGTSGNAKDRLFEQPPSQVIIESLPHENTPLQPSVPISQELQVSADKLFKHLQNLNFQRYTNAERSRTRTYITTELRKLGWTPKLEKFSDGVNIFAERQGTNKQAGSILVAAHYDTVAASPGAFWLQPIMTLLRLLQVPMITPVVWL